jgi:hypothetical protein
MNSLHYKVAKPCPSHFAHVSTTTAAAAAAAATTAAIFLRHVTKLHYNSSRFSLPAVHLQVRSYYVSLKSKKISPTSSLLNKRSRLRCECANVRRWPSAPRRYMHAQHLLVLVLALIGLIVVASASAFCLCHCLNDFCVHVRVQHAQKALPDVVRVVSVARRNRPPPSVSRQASKQASKGRRQTSGWWGRREGWEGREGRTHGPSRPCGAESRRCRPGRGPGY